MAFLLLWAATPAVAQTGIRPPRGLNVGVMGGGAAYSDLQRSGVRLERLTADGLEERSFPRRISVETSTAAGGWLSYWPTRSFGLRLQGTWSPSRFQVLATPSEGTFIGAESETGEPDLAGVEVITGDLQLLFRLPTLRNRVLPYGILGGGVTRYRTRGGEELLPSEAEEFFEDGSSVQPGGVFGLGAMLPLRNRAFRLHFELTDHVARTPIKSGGFVPGESRVRLTNSVQCMVGLSYSTAQ